MFGSPYTSCIGDKGCRSKARELLHAPSLFVFLTTTAVHGELDIDKIIYWGRSMEKPPDCNWISKIAPGSTGKD